MILSLDLVTGALSLLFTVMVLSYLIGDNPLFKIACLIVGVASGYAAAIVIWQVLVPKLFLPTWNIVQTRDYSSGILLVAPWLAICLYFDEDLASPGGDGAHCRRHTWSA